MLEYLFPVKISAKTHKINLLSTSNLHQFRDFLFLELQTNVYIILYSELIFFLKIHNANRDGQYLIHGVS